MYLLYSRGKGVLYEKGWWEEGRKSRIMRFLKELEDKFEMVIEFVKKGIFDVGSSYINRVLRVEVI